MANAERVTGQPPSGPVITSGAPVIEPAPLPPPPTSVLPIAVKKRTRIKTGWYWTHYVADGPVHHQCKLCIQARDKQIQVAREKGLDTTKIKVQVEWGLFRVLLFDCAFGSRCRSHG